METLVKEHFLSMFVISWLFSTGNDKLAYLLLKSQQVDLGEIFEGKFSEFNKHISHIHGKFLKIWERKSGKKIKESKPTNSPFNLWMGIDMKNAIDASIFKDFLKAFERDYGRLSIDDEHNTPITKPNPFKQKQKNGKK